MTRAGTQDSQNGDVASRVTSALKRIWLLILGFEERAPRLQGNKQETKMKKTKSLREEFEKK